MIHGIDKVNLEKLLCIDEEGKTRKHSFKSHANPNIGLNFFTWKVFNYRNHLTDEVVGCKSLSTFKIKLDEFMTGKGKSKFIVVKLMYDSFLLHVLF